MTADYANGITLAFIISRCFGWGLVLANDKWNLKVSSEEAVKLTVDQLAPISGTQGGGCTRHPHPARERRPGGRRHASWPYAFGGHASRWASTCQERETRLQRLRVA